MAKLKPHDPLAAVRKDPAKVTSLVLNPAHLRNKGFDSPPLLAFPQEILACKNLEKLEIFRGIASFDDDGDPSIPDGIGKLDALEKLTLGGLQYAKLPSAIGKLKKLRKLDLSYAEALTALPDTIGALKNLEELELTYTTALKTLPAAIGKLKKLKKLRLHAVKKVPPELFGLTELEALDLGGVEKVPPGLAKLKKLKALKLSARALASVGAEVAKLKKLRELTVAAKGARPPAAIWTLSGLESLSLRGLDLAALPSLEKLTSLTSLDVSDNELTALSAIIASLPALKKLSYDGNPLPIGEKRALDALMKLSPKKRAASVKSAPPAKKARPA